MRIKLKWFLIVPSWIVFHIITYPYVSFEGNQGVTLSACISSIWTIEITFGFIAILIYMWLSDKKLLNKDIVFFES